MSFYDFDHGFSAREVKFRKEQHAREETRAQWIRAEQLLSILRPVEFHPPSDKVRFGIWCEGAGKGYGYPAIGEYPAMTAERAFGPPILPGSVANIELLAASLGEFFRLVHVPSERSWYFHDYAVRAFRPTTDEKVALLASVLITKRALDSPEPARTHFIGMRPLVMDIVSVARHLLAADSTFFSGEQGAARFVHGRLLKPAKAPSYSLFAESAVELRPESVLTMSHAYHGYWKFCQSGLLTPVRRTEFKERFTNETLTRWGVGMRHDLRILSSPDAREKVCQGWMGLGLRSEIGMN